MRRGERINTGLSVLGAASFFDHEPRKLFSDGFDVFRFRDLDGECPFTFGTDYKNIFGCKEFTDKLYSFRASPDFGQRSLPVVIRVRDFNQSRNRSVSGFGSGYIS